MILTQPPIFPSSRLSALWFRVPGHTELRPSNCTTRLYYVRWTLLFLSSHFNEDSGIPWPPHAVAQLPSGECKHCNNTLSVYVGRELGVRLIQMLGLVSIFLSSLQRFRVRHNHSNIYVRYSRDPTTKVPELKDAIHCWLAVWILLSRKKPYLFYIGLSFFIYHISQRTVPTW